MVTLALLVALLAAPKPYVLSGAEEFALAADHRVIVGLPRGYESSGKTYRMLVVTDGDYGFPLVYGVARFLADRGELEPLVVVGLDYPGVSEKGFGPLYQRTRTRDFTPTHVADVGYGPEASRESGGADRFLDFIAKELLPYLGAHYRVNLADVGHLGYSFGGLLSSYALVTRPGLFRRALIVSPSLWYDGGYVFRVKRAPGIEARVYWAIGSREGTMVGEMRRFVRELPSRVESKVWVADDETHHSVFPGAAMRGLRWLYPPGSSR